MYFPVFSKKLGPFGIIIKNDSNTSYKWLLKIISQRSWHSDHIQLLSLILHVCNKTAAHVLYQKEEKKYQNQYSKSKERGTGVICWQCSWQHWISKTLTCQVLCVLSDVEQNCLDLVSFVDPAVPLGHLPINNNLDCSTMSCSARSWDTSSQWSEFYVFSFAVLL